MMPTHPLDIAMWGGGGIFFPFTQSWDFCKSYLQWNHGFKYRAVWQWCRIHYHWGTDLRYLDKTLAPSLLPTGSLFISNRAELCPRFSVGQGGEASKGYENHLDLPGRSLSDATAKKTDVVCLCLSRILCVCTLTAFVFADCVKRKGATFWIIHHIMFIIFHCHSN